MSRRSGSSSRWKQRQERDPYVERAVKEGWRSRAVFKLAQIHEKERLLRPGMRVVDLGATPGGWSQYAARIGGARGRVWAMDLLPMDPVPGVEFVLGDFTDAAVVDALEAAIGGQVDLVMSDMAPNISGNRAIDQPRSMGLAEDALWFAQHMLVPGGAFLIKLFQGEGFPEFVRGAREQFGAVRLVKPKASRPESREIYMLARNYGM